MENTNPGTIFWHLCLWRELASTGTANHGDFFWCRMTGFFSTKWGISSSTTHILSQTGKLSTNVWTVQTLLSLAEIISKIPRTSNKFQNFACRSHISSYVNRMEYGINMDNSKPCISTFDPPTATNDRTKSILKLTDFLFREIKPVFLSRIFSVYASSIWMWACWTDRPIL